MDLNEYYPRKVGEMFFLVNTRSSTFLKVNESVYDLVSTFRSKTTECGMDAVLAKYSLARKEYEKALADIARSLYDA